jgi:uncharacterized membrane protein YhaH (DUF805 family)
MKDNDGPRLDNLSDAQSDVNALAHSSVAFRYPAPAPASPTQSTAAPNNPDAVAGGTAGFRGRDGRVRYLVHLISSLTVPIALFAVARDSAHTLYENDFLLALSLAGLVGIAAVMWQLAATARRFHDLGRTGWAAILMLIPGVNLLTAGILCLWPGSDAPNRFGVVRRNGASIWLAYILLVILPIGLTPVALLQYDGYLQERQATRTPAG